MANSLLVVSKIAYQNSYKRCINLDQPHTFINGCSLLFLPLMANIHLPLMASTILKAGQCVKKTYLQFQNKIIQNNLFLRDLLRFNHNFWNVLRWSKFINTLDKHLKISMQETRLKINLLLIPEKITLIYNVT